MPLSAVLSLSGIAVTLLLAAAGYLVQWGIFKAKIEAADAKNVALSDRLDTVEKSFHDRCLHIEKELNQIGELRTSIGKIETGMSFILEQMKDMNASIRWLRQPAISNQPPDPA